MIYALLKTLHVLSIVVWVGGMFFSHHFLRPALADLDPPLRLRLMRDVLARFFRVVGVASILTVGTGVWMLGRVAKQAVQSGGAFQMPWAWTVMAALGLAMWVIFLVIRWRFFRQLDQAVSNAQWPVAAGSLQQIRRWVGINLALGLAVIVVTLASHG